MLYNKYFKIYMALIEGGRHRDRIVTEYYEKHHIIPKCAEGGNEKTNLVYLTAREHYLAHVLLPKFYEGKEKARLLCAVWRMIHGSPEQKTGAKMSARKYEKIKKLHSEARKLLQTGTTRSIETRQKMSAASMGRSVSQETRKKLSLLRKGKPWGCQNPKERARKISAALRGHKKSEDWIKKVNKNPEKIRKTAEAHRGMKRSQITKIKIGLSKLGKPAFNRGKKYYYNSKTKQKILCFPQEKPEGYVHGFLPK